jgi:di/tricarboxylate transporter
MFIFCAVVAGARDRGMKGQGAVVFLAVFIIFLMATIVVSSIPPGQAFYSFLGVPETDYPVLGVPTTILVIAVFNGVFYGVIVWLVFTFGKKFVKSK